LSIETYKTLVREYCPAIDIHSASLTKDGWVSDVLDVNGEYIFKFPKFDWTEELYEKEGLLLPRLARSLSFAVPSFEFDFRVHDRTFGRVVGYRKIIGEPLSKSSPHAGSLALHLGALLSEIHRFPVDRAHEAGVPVIDPSAWRHQYERHYRWLRDEAFRILSVSARVYTERLYEDFLSDESNFGFEPVLVHGDLGCEHILCDQRSGRIVGIIDWGEVMVGDPADDFAAIKVGLGGDLVRAVVSSYAGAPDAAFWRRVE
jgi:aminoglycoside 2''-phosphotransferase